MPRQLACEDGVVTGTVAVIALALLVQLLPAPLMPKQVRGAMRTSWPKLVDHLAATLESNLETDPKRVVVSQRARRLGSRWRAVFPLQDGRRHEVERSAAAGAA